MRRTAALFVYALAACCWIAGGPGGATLDAVLACRHHQAHHPHDGHAGTPSGGPCFCSEMTGGSDITISPAAPAPPAMPPVLPVARRGGAPTSPFPPPPSPPHPPQTPPPNAPPRPGPLA